MHSLNKVPSRRRDFLQASMISAASSALALMSADIAVAQDSAGQVNVGDSPLTQPPLPFARDALAPVISERTIEFHYGKHHKAYFDNVAKMTAGSALSSLSLEKLVVKSSQDPTLSSLFNNAAQAWNHNFYWKSLSPVQQMPGGRLKVLIERDFGSVQQLQKELAATSAAVFGSGWGWLVLDQGKLRVVKTSNADLPFIHGQLPLLTVDVWEHAYYLDYQNRRPDYLQAVIEKTLNWDFAAANMERA